MKRIPFLRPNLVKKDTYLSYISQIEKSRIYSNYGPLNALFESRLLDEYFQNEGAVTTVNNATAGLMLAISECKRPNGRYALMPSFTFAATPLAAIWCGLEPYFIDIRQDNFCMNEEFLSEAIKKLGDKVAVVVPYAAFGTCLNLSYYHSLINSVPVVVDAASSFGTADDNGHFGKGFPGTVVFSFHATKSFGIGEGGLVYSGQSDIINRIRQAGNFGFSEPRRLRYGNKFTGGTFNNLKIMGFSVAAGKCKRQMVKSPIRLYQLYARKINRTGILSNDYLKTISNPGYTSVRHATSMQNSGPVLIRIYR
jgi:dTDP-4-amino-4,6-dideoxygalactose transaminase